MQKNDFPLRGIGLLVGQLPLFLPTFSFVLSAQGRAGCWFAVASNTEKEES